jgi:hypothetical protein
MSVWVPGSDTELTATSEMNAVWSPRLPTNNRLTLAFKMAASSLRQSDTYLGAQFRRLRTRLGAPIAIKAMAARLARLVFRMLRYGMEYIDKGAEFY